MRHGPSAFIALPLVMAFLDCSSMSTTQKGAAIGGLEKAAAGGLVGSAVRHPVAGALVGGALGAGDGAIIGNQLQGHEGKSSNNSKRLTGKRRGETAARGASATKEAGRVLIQHRPRCNAETSKEHLSGVVSI
jgi:phage tail tape-measure protein